MQLCVIVTFVGRPTARWGKLRGSSDGAMGEGDWKMYIYTQHAHNVSTTSLHGGGGFSSESGAGGSI